MAEYQSSSLFLLLLFLLFAVYVSSVSAGKFSVGAEKGWNPGVNYTVWEEKNRPFYVGDWLVFQYKKGMADVIQVDEIGYNNCNATNPIYNYSKGRSYAFQLNETKRYYFICSYGYCYQGMKLSLLAEALPPPLPLPAPVAAPSAAPILTSPIGIFLVVFVAAITDLLRIV
ncbi:early nodulin-like protein 19 [Typha angustifolia]|uniref:early nodulin-like protein 19 n=1 Tax=Typha angustifolia TaxID=59011 RepID=UPI003C2C95BB